MPTISYFYGIVITMYQKGKEHNPPHIHAFYQDNCAAFSIEDAKLLEGKMPKRAISLIKRFIRDNKEELLKMWETGVFKRLRGVE